MHPIYLIQNQMTNVSDRAISITGQLSCSFRETTSNRTVEPIIDSEKPAESIARFAERRVESSFPILEQ